MVQTVQPIMNVPGLTGERVLDRVTAQQISFRQRLMSCLSKSDSEVRGKVSAGEINSDWPEQTSTLSRVALAISNIAPTQNHELIAYL